ncbi:MAG: DNA alkylation repair protein [Candidatus Pacebacteria bacterium]|nr:DNA alkylation repair protein [Candidatus Paceibacterota bacterium]
MKTLRDFEKSLQKKADGEKAEILQRFFKTGKGEYGEGDIFLGVVVPEQRKIAKEFKELSMLDLKKLIKSKVHEERLICLLILVLKFQKGNNKEKKEIYNFYLKNTKYINNWDLVDLSAPKIVGLYLEDRNKSILHKLARSKNIWERRIAILSTFHFIYKGNPEETLKIAFILKDDEHDLIHKAVGWMLREVGKKCGEGVEEKFLKKYYKTMPRTMLRYAIEKFPEKKRKFYLNNK